MIHFNRVFHYKPSILGYPYFWKPPYTNATWYTSNSCSTVPFPPSLDFHPWDGPPTAATMYKSSTSFSREFRPDGLVVKQMPPKGHNKTWHLPAGNKSIRKNPWEKVSWDFFLRFWWKPQKTKSCKPELEVVFRWPECTLKNSKHSINIVMRSDVDHSSTLRAQKICKTHRKKRSPNKVSTPPPWMPVANDSLGWNPLLKCIN